MFLNSGVLFFLFRKLSVVLELKHKYRLNYGDLFPPLGK